MHVTVLNLNTLHDHGSQFHGHVLCYSSTLLHARLTYMLQALPICYALPIVTGLCHLAECHLVIHIYLASDQHVDLRFKADCTTSG